MDSIDNIKRNRIRLLIYSIILLIVGMAMGFFAYYLYQHDKVEEERKMASYNREVADKKAIIIAENLLRDYTNYYEKILSSQDNKIDLNGNTAYQVSNSFNEIDNYFASNISINDLYNYYDYDKEEINSNDSKKPIYTKIDNNYYIDGSCETSNNKLSYSNFKIISRNEEKIELSYKISVLSVVDNSIIETIDSEKMILKYENNTWKINKASVVGRCGLPYSVS